MVEGVVPYIRVAAGVFCQAGRILLAQRPEGKPYAGYWEFPGGKIEPGESTAQTLVRELQEELGVTATTFYPWITLTYRYEHAVVVLTFYRVTAWEGVLRGCEGQAFAWQDPAAPTVTPMLPANLPVLRYLQAPSEYAITSLEDLGVDRQLASLAQRLAQGLRWVQIRDKHLSADDRYAWAQRVVSLCDQHGARALVNGDISLAHRVRAAGVHLTHQQLMCLTERPAVDWVAASCHDRESLLKAGDLGLDFAVLGPVNETPTHPGQAGMGWVKFASLIEGVSIPVLALGGLSKDHINEAWCAGATGVAMIRAAWT